MLQKPLLVCPDRLRREKQNGRARRELRDHYGQHKHFQDEIMNRCCERASEQLLTKTQDLMLPPLTTVVVMVAICVMKSA